MLVSCAVWVVGVWARAAAVVVAAAVKGIVSDDSDHDRLSARWPGRGRSDNEVERPVSDVRDLMPGWGVLPDGVAPQSHMSDLSLRRVSLGRRRASGFGQPASGTGY